MTVAGPLQLVVSLIYVWPVSRFGYLRVFQGTTFCWAALVLLAPHLSHFNANSAKATQFAVLSVFYCAQVRRQRT